MDTQTYSNEITDKIMIDLDPNSILISDPDEITIYAATWSTGSDPTFIADVSESDYFVYELCPDQKSYTISAKDRDSIPSLITIPREYNGLPVTKIKNDGFSYCTNLSIVLFEEKSNLRVIGSHAFQGCTNIESIELPASIRVIKSNAFRNCSKLQQVYLHSKFPPRLGQMAFYNTSSYDFLEIPIENNRSLIFLAN